VVEHVFTHFALTLRVLRAESNGEGEFVWTGRRGWGPAQRIPEGRQGGTDRLI
jgi:A/G-specific adenine glycosylase